MQANLLTLVVWACTFLGPVLDLQFKVVSKKANINRLGPMTVLYRSDVTHTDDSLTFDAWCAGNRIARSFLAVALLGLLLQSLGQRPCNQEFSISFRGYPSEICSVVSVLSVRVLRWWIYASLRQNRLSITTTRAQLTRPYHYSCPLPMRPTSPIEPNTSTNQFIELKIWWNGC